MERGFDKVSVREIAKEANVNLAMINYYFRSKENLVSIIIEKLSKKYYDKLNPIIISDMELVPKIEKYVSQFIDMLADEPGMVLFLLAVLKNEPDVLLQTKLSTYLFDTAVFFKQLQDEMEKGKIRKINPEQYYMCMLSLMLFPFSIIDVISDKNDYNSSRGITRYVKSRKEIVIQMLLKYLEP
jgi:TetR/AcrR family transcriptional regulator